MPESDRQWFFKYIEQGSTDYLENDYLKNYKKYKITLQEMVNYGPKGEGKMGEHGDWDFQKYGVFGEPLRRAIENYKVGKNPKNTKPIVDLLIKYGAKVENGEKGNTDYFNAMSECFYYINSSQSATIPLSIVKHMTPKYLNIPVALNIKYKTFKKSFLDWAETWAKDYENDDYNKEWKNLATLMKKYGALTTDEITKRQKRAKQKIDLEQMIKYAEATKNKDKKTEERIINLKKELQTLIDEEINELEIEKKRLNALKCKNIIFSNDKGCDTKKEDMQNVEKQITQKTEEKKKYILKFKF